jgi:hypothetical protein
VRHEILPILLLPKELCVRCCVIQRKNQLKQLQSKSPVFASPVSPSPPEYPHLVESPRSSPISLVSTITTFSTVITVTLVTAAASC